MSVSWTANTPLLLVEIIPAEALVSFSSEIVCVRCVRRVGKIDNVREMESKHCTANLHSSDVLIMLRARTRTGRD